MEWLWMPAVGLLAVFLFALCCYFFSGYSCCRRKRTSYLPTSLSLEDVANNTTAAAPSAPPTTPNGSPVVSLTLGTKKLRDIIFEENGIPTLDLHDMTVAEAKSATNGFIQRQRILGFSQMQIITGKGLHSDNKIPKIKPAIMNILMSEGLNFRETCQGGAYLVYF